MSNPFENQTTTPDQETLEPVVEEKNETKEIQTQVRAILEWIKKQKTLKAQRPSSHETVTVAPSVIHIENVPGETKEDRKHRTSLIVNGTMSSIGHYAFIKLLASSAEEKAKLQGDDLRHFNTQLANLEELKATSPSHFVDPTTGQITIDHKIIAPTTEPISNPTDYIKEMGLRITEWPSIAQDPEAEIDMSSKILRGFGESASRLGLEDIKQIVEEVITNLQSKEISNDQGEQEQQKAGLQEARDRIANL